MSACLENCPNEVVESIVVLLALSDICSLRQTSRNMAAKTTQSHFKSYFLTKHVDITGSALQSFIDLTQSGSLGCLIQHVVLVGVVNNTKLLESILDEESDLEEEGQGNRERKIKAQQDLDILEQRQTDYEQLHGSGTDVSLLSKAFVNIMGNSKTGKLHSLSLEVVVYREDAEKRLPPAVRSSWRFIWRSAADTFNTAIRSLAASRLPIEKLNIFNNSQLQRCSLDCSELGSIDVEDEGLAISLASLKSLSVSVSDRVVFRSRSDAERSYDPAEDMDFEFEGARDLDDIRAEEQDERNFLGLAKLLQISSQLEALELHQYRLTSGWGYGVVLHLERLLQRAAELNMPPNLRRVELRGLHVRGQDLLTFIQRTGVRELIMVNVFMISGTFRSVFDICTSEAAGMEKLYFSKLAQGNTHEPVYFDEPGISHDPPAVPGPSSSSLDRVGAEVRQQIIYGPMVGGLVRPSSPESHELAREHRREYGPP